MKYLPLYVIVALVAVSGTAHAEELSADASTDVSAAGVSAQSDVRLDFSTRLEEFRKEQSDRMEDMKEKRLEFQSAIKTRAAEIKADLDVRGKISESSKQRIEALRDRLFVSFEKSLDRLDELSAKIDARIELLSERGVDTDEAAELHADAKARLAVAEDRVASIEAEVDAKINGETSRKEIRSLMQEARDEVKEARDEFVDVINSLRASVKASAEAEVE